MKISLEDFIVLLPQLQARMQDAAQQAMVDVAETVVEAAKNKIGHQQQGWDALASATIEEKIKQGYPEGALLREGDLRDSYTYAIEGLTAVIGSEDPIAEYQEIGTSSIPPRPVILPAVMENAKLIETMIGEAVVDALSGKDQE